MVIEVSRFRGDKRSDGYRYRWRDPVSEKKEGTVGRGEKSRNCRGPGRGRKKFGKQEESESEAEGEAELKQKIQTQGQLVFFPNLDKPGMDSKKVFVLGK